jgi:uncharacterized protein (DUF362 family)
MKLLLKPAGLIKKGVYIAQEPDPAGFTQNLKLINVPVLKDHWYTSLTCSLKHTYGILSMAADFDNLKFP